MKSYATYKPTGIAWLPQIPEHWNLVRGKNLYQKMQRSVNDTDEVVTCFRDGTVTLRKNRRTKGFTESLKEFGYQGIRKGDLVIHVMDAFAGAIGVSDSDGKGTPVYSVCQAKGNSNNQYYAFLLREMARSGFIQSLYRGIRERSSDFRFEVFASQFYPVPPRDEQDQIVRFLDWKVSVINHLINVKHREIKAIDEIKRSMISNAVTHGINFDTPMKYSGIKWLGVIPIHWKLIRGKNLYEKLQRPVKNTDDVVTCFRDGTVTLRKNRRTTGFTESLKEIGYQGIQKGDLVIHVMDAFAGSIGVSDSDGKGTPVYSICQAKTDSNNYYYAFLLREMARTGFIQSLYRGIRERSSDFRFEVFGKQFYPAPPRAEQDEIVDYLGKRTEEIEKYITIRKLQIAELEDLRRCLISDVVTGKIDVRGIEIPDYEFIAEESPDDADASEDEMGSEVEEN